MTIPERLTTLATVVSAAAGLALLAFVNGFLAQRAQYAFAQIPFMFVDYQAYVEVGFQFAFDTFRQMLASWGWLTLLVALSVFSVLALEFDAFRARLLRPGWLVLGYCATLLVVVLLLRQQWAVGNEIRIAQIGAAETQGEAGHTAAKPVLPVRWPFGAGVADELKQDLTEEELVKHLPRTSYDGWAEIVERLERSSKRGGGLRVRPAPFWAIEVETRAADDKEASTPTIFGIAVDARQVEERRAKDLYRTIVVGTAAALWCLTVCGLWSRRVRGILGGVEQLPARAPQLGRFAQEWWFVASRILRPIGWFLALFAAVLYLPQCYGWLAMPQVGQEFVSVITSSQGSEAPRHAAAAGAASARRASTSAGGVNPSAAPPGTKSGTAKSTPAPPGTQPDESAKSNPEGFDARKYLQKGLGISRQYQIADTTRRFKLMEDWRDLVRSLLNSGHPAAAEALQRLGWYAEILAPGLVTVATTARSQLAESLRLASSGYVLHYPRAENATLPVLEPASERFAGKDLITTVPVREVRSVNVGGDPRDLELASILSPIGTLDPKGRIDALVRAEEIGHPAYLEVALAGLSDPSSSVRGPSISDVGHYAAAHRETSGTRDFAYRLAIAALLKTLDDETEYEKLRGAAVTALQFSATPKDERVCGALTAILRTHLDARSTIQHSNLVRPSVTAAGNLQCRDAAPILRALLADPETDLDVRGAAPTALSRICEPKDCFEALAEVIVDPTTPVVVVGTAITAVQFVDSYSGHRDVARSDVLTQTAVAALMKVIASPARDGVDPREWRVMRASAADSLRALASPVAAESLTRWLAASTSADDLAVRAKVVLALHALVGLLDYDNIAVEAQLAKLYRDPEEAPPIRAFALLAISELENHKSLDEIVAWARQQNPSDLGELVESVVLDICNENLGSDYIRRQCEVLAEEWAELKKNTDPPSPEELLQMMELMQLIERMKQPQEPDSLPPGDQPELLRSAPEEDM